MGRKSSSLTWQIIDSLDTLQKYGEAKNSKGFYNRTNGIHSVSTYDKYKDVCIKFGKWVKAEHGIKHFKDLKEDGKDLAKGYLEYRKKCLDSPYALRLYGCAIAKLLRCKSTDFGFEYPARNRENITRSRKDRFHDTEISKFNHKDIMSFGRYTGLRRRELSLLKPEQIKKDKAGRVYIEFNKKKYGPQSKGGRDRLAYVLVSGEKHVLKMRDKAINEGRERVFKHITNRIDEHSLRREYAKLYYKYLFKKEYSGREEIIYDYHTKDGSNRKFIKELLKIVSKNLGHNRLDVIVKHYLD